MPHTLTFEEHVNAPASVVYKAFTHPTLLSQWFADAARIDKREGGINLFTWNSGFYAVATFKTLDADQRLTMTWRGSSEPADSEITVGLTEANSVTAVHITHMAADGADVEAVRRSWIDALSNLKYLLEVGFDQRLMTRPMLGIFPGHLDEERAARLGLTGIKGLYINGVVEGMGAAAVLQKEDALVSLGGKPVIDFPSLQLAIAPHKGGAVVTVEFYRAGQKHSADMLLSKRPAPEIPPSLSALVEILRANFAEVSVEMDAVVAGVPDEVMNRRPEAKEWSANENIAHLIWTTRVNHGWLFNMVGGDDNVIWMNNNDLHLVASTAAYTSTGELVTEWKRAETALIGQVEALPVDFATIKPFFSYVTQNLTQTSAHTREHFEQMRGAIAAVMQPPS